MSTTYRSRLTCAACTRRKVKCSKTVPCTNCIKRGQQDICGIDEPHNNQVSPRHGFSSRDQGQLEERFRQRCPVRDEATPANPQIETPQHASADEPRDKSDGATVVQDAATILEFLAWGRRKDPDCHTVTSLEPADEPETGPNTLDDCSQVSFLQLLLPDPRQVRQLADFRLIVCCGIIAASSLPPSRPSSTTFTVTMTGSSISLPSTFSGCRFSFRFSRRA
jgi:hypothetical protein